MSFFSNFFIQSNNTNPATTSSGSSHSHHHSDSYYGHEETAKICARFVSHTFNCPEMLPPSTSVTTTSAGNPSVPPTLAHFVAYALHRTRLHPSVTFTALALLCRLKTRFPAARGSSGHRLFLSAFMIGSKVVCDDTYSNKSWAVVGQGMFALREINQMEREMCAYLEWHLNVPEEDLKAFEKEVRRVYSNPPPYAPGTVVTLGSAASNASVSAGAAAANAAGTSAPAPVTHLAAVPESKESLSSERNPLANAQLPTPTDGPTIMPFAANGNGISSKPILAPINTNFSTRAAAVQPAATSTAHGKTHSMPTPPASPPPHSASSQSTTGATLGYHELASSGPSGSGSSPITDSPSPASSEESLQTPPNSQWPGSYTTHTQATYAHGHAHPHAHPQLAKSMSLPASQGGVNVSVAVARHTQPQGQGRNSIDGVGVEGAESMDDEKRGVAYYAAYAPVQSGGPHMALKQQQQSMTMRGSQRSQSLPTATQNQATTQGATQTQGQTQNGQQQTRPQQRGSGRTFTVPCAW
jgi:hypothetical protein